MTLGASNCEQWAPWSNRNFFDKLPWFCEFLPRFRCSPSDYYTSLTLPTLAAVIEECPAEKKASVVDCPVRFENDQNSWARWGNDRRDDSADLRQLRRGGVVAIIQPHIVVVTISPTMIFEWQFVECNEYHLQNIQQSTEYIGWSDVTESMVTVRSPFCGYNAA